MEISVEANALDPANAKSTKGLKKRAQLLSAALRIIARDGHYQLTLRNVGVEAK